jgi:hypothetical protein
MRWVLIRSANAMRCENVFAVPSLIFISLIQASTCIRNKGWWKSSSLLRHFVLSRFHSSSWFHPGLHWTGSAGCPDPLPAVTPAAAAAATAAATTATAWQVLSESVSDVWNRTLANKVEGRASISRSKGWRKSSTSFVFEIGQEWFEHLKLHLWRPETFLWITSQLCMFELGLSLFFLELDSL